MVTYFPAVPNVLDINIKKKLYTLVNRPAFTCGMQLWKNIARPNTKLLEAKENKILQAAKHMENVYSRGL